MRAVRIHQFGTAENLIYEDDVPEPTPLHGEVKVRVHACALNHLDIWVRNGIPAYQTPLPHILGSDIAGEVAEVGPGVTDWRPGDLVVIYPVISCGQCRFCRTGRENLCVQVQVIGAHRAGGYAEYIVVPARNLLPKPTILSYEEASAVPLVFLTAWHMLMTLGRLQPGEWVLIMGGSSGVGSAGIQIAKLRGALVIATAGNQTKMQKCLELGADAVVNHNDSEWWKKVKELTEGEGIDVVFEHIGQAVFDSCVRLLNKGGRLVTCGATTGQTAQFDIRYVFSREIEIHGAYIGTRVELAQLLPHVERGRLKPVVDSVFPLAEARKAHEKLESRDFFGKIVLKI
ncbi:NADPH:quinone reductase [Armatimonadetes bacterium GBS]|jgi:NADPH:quinone reductase-like Zn-dependent oxidoreductase|nr:MAG: alcohol dehydrogenase [Fimbriimonadales bacterium]CUU04084.1 NADPH:quinone reductase [Armatimonadetes bacterium GBS]CUU38432.1 NADPH:quinone reductase [Armatimonadetes bacterium GXS]